MPEDLGPTDGLEARTFEDPRQRGEDDLRFILPWLSSFLIWLLSGKVQHGHDPRGNSGLYAPVYHNYNIVELYGHGHCRS